jgi:hypothetical protein
MLKLQIACEGVYGEQHPSLLPGSGWNIMLCTKAQP